MAKTKKNQYFPQSIPHPGVTLDEKIKEMGLSIDDFAEKSRLTTSEIISIINGNASILPLTADKIEAATMIPSAFWLRSQKSYNDWIKSAGADYSHVMVAPANIEGLRLPGISSMVSSKELD